jgi:hypothetical protein
MLYILVFNRNKVVQRAASSSVLEIFVQSSHAQKNHKTKQLCDHHIILLGQRIDQVIPISQVFLS